MNEPDDLRAARSAASGIATRLDPRSLDRAHYGVVEALASARAGETVRIPIFSKAEDDATSFAEVEGPFDVVIYEGWRVGVRPGEFYGPGGEGGAFEYEELNRPINYLMCARATGRERESGPRARARAPRWGPRLEIARESTCIRASLLSTPVFPPLLPGYLDANLDDVRDGSCAEPPRPALRAAARRRPRVGAGRGEGRDALWDGWIVPFVERHQQSLVRAGACDECSRRTRSTT